MLVEFSFGNFRSFRDVQTISMRTSSLKPAYPELVRHNVIHNDRYDLLKSKSIYGANASGKSNVAWAFMAFAQIVGMSALDLRKRFMHTNVFPFLFQEGYESRPCYFQIVFEMDETTYRYGFETTRERIVSEWLFVKKKVREVEYFTRNLDSLRVSRNYKEGKKFEKFFDTGNPIGRPDALFLSALATVGEELSRKLQREFAGLTLLINVDLILRYQEVAALIENQAVRNKVLDFLKTSDTWIDGLAVESAQTLMGKAGDNALQKPNDKFIFAQHKKFNTKGQPITSGLQGMEFSQFESGGTNRLLMIADLVLNALDNGKLIVIDEFDARFHPRITRKILDLFHSKKNKQGQLIYITHDVNLLTPKIQRREQITFVDKDKMGASYLTNLAEFKGVRNEESFENSYMQGKFGAVPVVGDFEELI